MTPPIFVVALNCGEVFAFNSVDLAMTWPEEVDVENGEYVVWDSDGSLLNLVLRDKAIMLEPAPPCATPSEDFDTVLRRFLVQFGEPEPHPSLSRADLLTLCEPHVIVSQEATGCSPLSRLLGWLKRSPSTR